MVNTFIASAGFRLSHRRYTVLTDLIAYRLLPLAQFPDITPPQVVVTATYPVPAGSRDF
jgi:HAE1 family hydrophobic/amphiphilic exporter-1